MRILILGGNGFIGKALQARLIGHDVVVLHRGRPDTKPLPAVRLLKGDLADISSLAQLVARERPDVVVDMFAMNGEQALPRAQAMAGQVGRVVVVSSGSVYLSFGRLCGTEPGPLLNEPFDEWMPVRTRLFPYRGETGAQERYRFLETYDKLEVERVYSAEPGLRCAIARLPMVYGPGDADHRLVPYLMRMEAGRPCIYLHDDAASWRNSRMYVDDAAEALCTLVLNEQALGVYNVADEKALTEAQWVAAIGQMMGWSGRVIRVPVAQARWARPRIDELPARADFRQHLTMASKRLRDELDYREVVGLERGLQRTVRTTACLPMGESLAQDLEMDLRVGKGEVRALEALDA